MVCTDSARLGKCLCPICVSGYCPGTFLFLPIGTICHRRLVHCAKHCRPASLPIYARHIRKQRWKSILLADAKYLLWVYVWFYLAWGLNYSQKNFYERTHIPYIAYTPENFQKFVDSYIKNLNGSYTDITSINETLACHESVRAYNQISDSLGVHRPFHQSPRVKTMLFTLDFDGRRHRQHGAFLL